MFNKILRPEHLKNIQLLTLGKGEPVFRENDPSSAVMYYVLDGKVGVFKERKGGQVMIHEVEKGGFFGELGLISSNPRLATMTVTSANARLAVIREEYFVDKADISSDFLLTIFYASIFRTIMARRKLSRCLTSQTAKDMARFDLSFQVKNRVSIHDVIANANLNYRTYKQGEYLYRTGMPIEIPGVTFIDTGAVAMTFPVGKHVLPAGTLPAGDFYSEETLTSDFNARYTYTKQALKETRTILLERELFLKVIKVHPDVLYSMLKNIITRLSIIERAITESINSGS
jgi:CRP-like cAMP-binding protein